MQTEPLDIQSNSDVRINCSVPESKPIQGRAAYNSKQNPGHYLLLATVLLLAGLVYLLGNQRITLWDRDEPRFAQAAREMFQRQDFIVPHFNGNYRFDKPVLVYWLMAGNYRLFGACDFAARLGSGICGVLACALTYLLGRGLFNRRIGLTGSAILAGCPLVIAESKLATADALLAVFLVAVLGLWLAMQTGKWRRPLIILLGAALGLGTLTKGPVIWLFLWAGSMGAVLLQMRRKNLWLGVLTVASVTVLAGLYLWLGMPRQVQNAEQIAALLGWLGGGLIVLALPVAGAISLGKNPPEGLGPRTLKSFGLVLIGMLIAAAIFLPWGLTAVARTNGAYWTEGVGRHVVQRSAQSLEGHWGPPGFYLAGWLVCAFPFSVLGPLAVWQAWRIRKRDWRMSGLLGWVLGPWLVLEVVQTKLVHYVLGCYPAMALLIAVLLYRWRGKLRKELLSKTLGRMGLSALWIIAGLLGAAMLVVGIMTVGLLAEMGIEGIARYQLLLASAAAGAVTLLTGLAVRKSLLAGRSTATVVWGFTGVMTWAVIAGVWLLPTVSQYRISPRAAAAAKQISPSGTQFVLFGFDEPSLIWNLGSARLDKPPGDYKNVLIPKKAEQFVADFQQDQPVCAIVSEKKLAQLISASFDRPGEGTWVEGIYPADVRKIKLWVGLNKPAMLQKAAEATFE